MEYVTRFHKNHIIFELEFMAVYFGGRRRRRHVHFLKGFFKCKRGARASQSLARLRREIANLCARFLQVFFPSIFSSKKRAKPRQRRAQRALFVFLFRLGSIFLSPSSHLFCLLRTCPLRGIIWFNEHNFQVFMDSSPPREAFEGGKMMMVKKECCAHDDKCVITFLCSSLTPTLGGETKAPARRIMVNLIRYSLVHWWAARSSLEPFVSSRITHELNSKLMRLTTFVFRSELYKEKRSQKRKVSIVRLSLVRGGWDRRQKAVSER